MSHPPPEPRLRIRTVLVGTVAGLLAIATYFVFEPFLEPLVFGGARNLGRLLRDGDFANPALGGVLLGIVALGIGVHLFAGWLSSESQRERADKTPWRTRWSALLVALFGLGYAMVRRRRAAATAVSEAGAAGAPTRTSNS